MIVTMFLLSKLLPFLKTRPRKQPTVTGDLDLPSLGDRNKSDFLCKVLLLDDSEIVVHSKVGMSGAVGDTIFLKLGTS